MRSTRRIATVLSALLLTAVPLAAQAPPSESPSGGSAPAAQEQEKKEQPKGRTPTIQHLRPADQRGLNVFETPKDPGVEYSGFKLDFGAAFTSQVQALSHETAAVPVVANGVNQNQLA